MLNFVLIYLLFLALFIRVSLLCHHVHQSSGGSGTNDTCSTKVLVERKAEHGELVDGDEHRFAQPAIAERALAGAVLDQIDRQQYLMVMT